MTSPRVFFDYDQRALDDAYDQAVYAANYKQILARRANISQRVRERLGEPQRLAYGPTPAEKLDLYPTKRAGAPVCVFIHGGAWRAGLARDYAFPAEMLVDAGAHLAVLDFDNVIDAKGDLFVMADQVLRAIAWIGRSAGQFGGDAGRVHVVGTSSGAHLGGVAATTDWQKDFGLPGDCVKSYTLVSGMYDLRGPRLSKRSSYVTFTDEMEEALSPQRHLCRIVAPVALIYGTLETPEFQRQSCDFAAALRQAGKPCTLIVAEGYNHFEVGETLGNPYGPAGRTLLAQMCVR